MSVVFSRNHLYFGSAVRIEEVVKDRDFRDLLLLRECDWLTPEVALKWAAVERSPGSFNFASMDALIYFALANKKRLRGHTLVWHKSVPQWAQSSLLEKDGWTLVQRYFQAALGLVVLLPRLPVTNT